MYLKELDANLIVVLDALLIDASVTKAAERLGRSPSAVSHALANLRIIFDDELFVRAGQRLTPTIKAKALASTVHIIVSGLESLLRPTSPFNPGTQERSFILASPEMTELYLLPGLCEKISQEAPNIFINRVGQESPGFLEELRLGRIDFALMEGDLNLQVPDMRWEKIYEENYVTFAKKDENRKYNKISLKQFEKMPHIIAESNMMKSSVLEVEFLKHKLPMERLIKVTSSLTGIFLALEMNGLVTIPRLHSENISNHISITQVTLPFELPKLNIYLGWHRSFERDECHQWLRQKFQNYFKNEITKH